MKKLSMTLEQGIRSNVQMTITLSTTQLNEYKEKALMDFAKTYKVDGFRPGKVPMKMVKEAVNEVYLEMDAINDIVNDSLNEVIKEYSDYKFIGQPYDFDRKTQGESEIIISYKLDVYPEVKVINDNWKTATMRIIDNTISENELSEALNSLKHQYATYHDTDSITHHSVDRLKAIYMDSEGHEIWTKTLFIDHADKHDGGFHHLEGKIVGDIVQMPYTTTIPSKLQYTKDNQIPTTITLEVLRIQKEELPERDDKTIGELFGNEGIKTQSDLTERIQEVMKQQKHSNELIQSINDYVHAITPSFQLTIPQSMIHSEYEHRYEAMTKQFGDKQKFEQAYLSLPNGKEELEKRQQELKDISNNSLMKFFTLQKVTELLEIPNIDWSKDMDVETKLYEHFYKA
ncbi:MAG TPA: trigger factor [Candidatus Absconditabacterales bacterium]|nr:trigger factor [Candidatus Absconditabacterales bacterium]